MSLATKVDALIGTWRDRAKEYQQRHEIFTNKGEHVIAAQQAGIAVALRLAANELAMLCEPKARP